MRSRPVSLRRSEVTVTVGGVWVIAIPQAPQPALAGGKESLVSANYFPRIKSRTAPRSTLSGEHFPATAVQPESGVLAGSTALGVFPRQVARRLTPHAR